MGVLTFKLFKIFSISLILFGSLNLNLKQRRMMPYWFSKVGSYLVVA